MEKNKATCTLFRPLFKHINCNKTSLRQMGNLHMNWCCDTINLIRFDGMMSVFQKTGILLLKIQTDVFMDKIRLQKC